MKFFQQNQIFYSDETIESLKNILGVYFVKLRDFFYKKFFSYDCNKSTILVTRRCFLLASWYLGYFFMQDDIKKKYLYVVDDSENEIGYVFIEDKNTHKKNFLISDKGIYNLHFLKNSVDIEECVILDDICIHGRQLARLKSKVEEMFKFAVVRREVFMKSNESIVSDVESCELNTSKAQWLIPSQKIVEAINFLSLPYESCINSFIKVNVSEMDNQDLINDLMEDSSLFVVHYGNEDRQLLGKESYLIFEKSLVLNSKWSQGLSCIKYSYNFDTGISSFIPVVVPAPLKIERNENSISDIFSKYLILEARQQLKELIELAVGKDYSYDYLFNLLSCIASTHYGFVFARKYLKGKFNFLYEKLWHSDICSCISMTFGHRIASIISFPNNYNMEFMREQKERFETFELLDLSSDLNVTTMKRWIEREYAAVKRIVEPSKSSLFTLIRNTIKNKYKENNLVPENLIAYSYLFSVINNCDNGRQNISSKFNEGECFLEVGELGVNTLREYGQIRESAKELEIYDKVNLLLDMPYYYYILS